MRLVGCWTQNGAMSNPEAGSSMVTVRGVPTYLERRGLGPSLVYLHGATEWVGYSSEFVEHLEHGYDVVQPERRGHGRTPDVPGDLTFTGMTEDTIAAIEQLGLDRPGVVGFSDGANIALLMAMARPELIGRVVAIGPNMSVSGLTEETLEWLADVTPETWPEESRHMYATLSPDGAGHWPTFAQKVIDMLRREPEVGYDQLAAIRVPTLIIGADRDMVRLEHLIEIHRAIPDSQLCIIPGAGHELTVEHPALTAQITLRFLRQDDSLP